MSSKTPPKQGLFRWIASFALDHDVNRAIETQHEVNTQFPDFAEGVFNLGVLYYSQKRTDEAIMAYLHALALDPTFAKAHKNLGEIYVVQEQYELAWRHARLAARHGNTKLIEMMRRYLEEPPE
ncbi:MAG: tetratricopeptide repeat protein [candidate division Zixibacteria bacterium]|nr:tetratricopeptide repeat protein [candidate division Zixibacteria bacterium]